MQPQAQRTYCGPVRGVILDWAGTAVDYGSFAPVAVFVRLFEQRGVPITPADARAGMGLMKKDHLRAILERPAVAAAWRSVYGAPPAERDINELFAQFVPLQMSVVQEYATPVPGLIDAVTELRKRGVRIGTTTGYLRAMMDILAPAAAARGYRPDSIVCPDDVPAGRPAPWMCFQNAMRLGVYPMAALVKVGDTLADIEEGLNAGMWTVGVTLTSSLLGLTESEVGALTPSERADAHARIGEQLYAVGAHLVIEGVWDLPRAIDEIEDRIQRGETPTM
ncbi:MAG: phosphonoacetaldehyde hydrolase [Roseiflexus sp.]|nr:phosphonoacetaldehyde hydrolase [Roseiflexus sp.]MCS7288404.1 phosphonoacetaldehyde hydrolase [Roseiflexus sp.]MDW8146553.1 phosphonoacetaldehyde hydrolase [Roseiflexaceae bacterium]MDW8231167.1 phosphonoacetaldehyde hydrolase [Roseiflexaceae bacterium]